jgi:hypothetical protein
MSHYPANPPRRSQRFDVVHQVTWDGAQPSGGVTRKWPKNEPLSKRQAVLNFGRGPERGNAPSGELRVGNDDSSEGSSLNLPHN